MYSIFIDILKDRYKTSYDDGDVACSKPVISLIIKVCSFCLVYVTD